MTTLFIVPRPGTNTFACFKTPIKQAVILFFIFLSTAAFAQYPCIYEGEIGYGQDGDDLHFSFSELPEFDCSEPVVIDSVKVKWYQQCNRWNDKFTLIGETNLEDTLTIPAVGWRAVWAQTTWYSKDFVNNGAITVSTSAAFYIGPDAPDLLEDITPNPNNGHFEIEQKTNALKQYTMILGPYGLVYSKWHYGNCIVPIDLLPLNPNGLYQVITTWYFADDCVGKTVTRQGFIVAR